MRKLACPTCKAPVEKGAPGTAKLYPFCSERCHLIDLGRWLGEEYRIAGDPAGSIGEAGVGGRGRDDDA